MQNLVKLLNELKDRQFKITIDKNGKSKLQQTQRNGLKAEILTALMDDIKSVYPELVFRTDEGIVLEIANDCVADNLDGESEGSGAITVAIDLKVKDLDSNATDLANAYAIDLAEKTEKANAKAKAKADKIASDTARRKKNGGV
jgi:hypothetical protein